MCLQNTNTGTLKPEDHLVLFLHLLLLLLLLKKKKMMIFQLQGKPSSERILLYKPISSSCSKRFHLDRRTRDAQSILQKSFFLWHSESPKGTFEKWVDKEWSRARSNDISVSTHWKVGLICEHIACSDRKKHETSNFSDERKVCKMSQNILKLQVIWETQLAVNEFITYTGENNQSRWSFTPTRFCKCKHVLQIISLSVAGARR